MWCALILPIPVSHVPETGRFRLAGYRQTKVSSSRGVAASLAASALLFGCAAPLQQASLPEATRTCLAQNRGFTDAWGCIQARYAAAEPDKADPRLRVFLRLGDSLAMQVSARTLSEASARIRLAAKVPDDRKTIVDGVSQLVRSLAIARP